MWMIFVSVLSGFDVDVDYYATIRRIYWIRFTAKELNNITNQLCIGFIHGLYIML